MPGLTDTSIEAETIQLNLLRQVPPRQKLQMLTQLNQTALRLALVGLHQRYPSATPAQLRRHLADLLLGESLAEEVYGPHAVTSEQDDVT